MQNSDNKSIAVIGAGSWGTALAILLSRNGVRTLLWGNEAEHQKEMQQCRSNESYLPGIAFPEKLEIVLTIEEAVEHAQHVLVVVPSHAFRIVLEQLRPLLREGMNVLWATKGLESKTGKLLHEVVEETLGAEQVYAVVSGPTFAKEVANGLPTAITVASNDEAFAADIAAMLHNDTFRSYTCNDVIGVELGGSVKNVLAIAAGIADGLGFGANTRAALITRGLHEIMNLGVALGGQHETFMGLAGLGDLVLTCTDNQSRNRRFGIALAEGKTQDEARKAIGQVVEGVQTASEVMRVAKRIGIEMPITEQVYQVLNENVDPHEAVQNLFRRELKPEFN
jgi:glycerol-3-phosphate dehydrogenase (NAD(P)+)